ncbi:MAG: transaldolase family protein [Oscillospiraceae bacterium]|nr:transaldolase family protein [Oscillospiraceae bacterium]
MALEHGARNCTTNPAFCSRLLKTEDKGHLDGIIDNVIDSHNALRDNSRDDSRVDTRNNLRDDSVNNPKDSPKGDRMNISRDNLLNAGFDYEEAALNVYRQATLKIMKLFMPRFIASNGKYGYVTLQDDPRFDDDTEHIIRGIEEGIKLSPNYMAKIPVIKGGIEAIEYCVERDVPICATEVFAINQAVHICEKYSAASRRTGNHPAFYVTHISGIFDEYLAKLVKANGLDISEEIIKEAGISIAKKQFRIFKEKGYNFTILGGGARGAHHFTGLVGGPHITINWSTAKELLDGDYAIKEAIYEEPDKNIIMELREKSDIFKKAYDEEGLSVDEFAGFGPVQLFRNSFLNGWYILLAEIALRRHARAV